MTSVLAAWTGPLAMAVVAAAVFHGEARAPLLALVVLVAPLAGLLRPLAPGDHTAGVPRAAVTLGVAALALAAQLRFAADVGIVCLALARWVTVAAAVGVLLVAAALAGGGGGRLGMVPIAVVALAAPLMALALASGVAPWTAWTAVAARPAASFGPWSAWTHDGARIAISTTLTFTESHRVTAMAPGVFRVVEHDGPTPAARDWYLGAGESLPLRAGDELSLLPGTRVRFEAGKRVPGATVSGMDWAQPVSDPPLRSLAWLSALTLAFVGGGIALGDVGDVPSRVPALAAAGVAALLGVAGVTWGVYTAYLAPDVAMGSLPVAALAHAPLHALGAPLSTTATATLAAGLAASLVAAALALQRVIARALGTTTGGEKTVWGLFAVTLLAAAGLALSGAEAWGMLVSGLALAAAALTAPAFAATGARARNAGALVGSIVFVAAALALGVWRAGVPLGPYPALLAAPLAWLTARLARPAVRAPSRRRAASSAR